ncbi:hypothetical protein [Mycolicibacterium vanbaalenii]|uniref:hypothetical protein n=1 Tax=Mycolicibacterium vanbaalenii TaxID=110539 RepID=UPI0013300A0B|nr:hypothetical protein [Mycolicibacterium vanbaalenii]
MATPRNRFDITINAANSSGIAAVVCPLGSVLSANAPLIATSSGRDNTWYFSTWVTACPSDNPGLHRGSTVFVVEERDPGRGEGTPTLVG